MFSTFSAQRSAPRSQWFEAGNYQTTFCCQIMLSKKSSNDASSSLSDLAKLGASEADTAGGAGAGAGVDDCEGVGDAAPGMSSNAVSSKQAAASVDVAP